MRFLLNHGYLLLTACVFGEQIGLPIHSAPLLLALGSLAASGRMSLMTALGLAVAASLAADVIWYELGRRRGAAVLRFIGRVSRRPDWAADFAENAFSRHRTKILLTAKFVPGLSMIAPPMAGASGMTVIRFLAWDFAATLIWAGGYSVAGYFFGTELQTLARTAPDGSLQWLAVLAGSLLIAYLAARFIRAWQENRRLSALEANNPQLVASFFGEDEAVPSNAALAGWGAVRIASGSTAMLHKAWRVLGRSWHAHYQQFRAAQVQCAGIIWGGRCRASACGIGA